MHPHIFLTQQKCEGLRSLGEVREATREGHAARLWGEILRGADADLEADVLLPSSMFPGRSPMQARHANRDYTICSAVQLRLHRDAMAALLTGEMRYAEAALRQMDALFDPERWPRWRDLSHGNQGLDADLRTGMFAKSVGFVYDWLHPLLDDGRRAWVLEGLERCGIAPFLQSVEAGAWWFAGTNNWTTCVTGGLGIAGMALDEDHPDAPRLVEMSLPIMRKYFEVLGPEGEHNESVGYSGSMEAPVTYWGAYRYHTRGAENVLEHPVFARFGRWYTYFTVPPGRVISFGDAHLAAPPHASMFAALAAAARDGLFQWFYLEHSGASPRRDPVMELLWFDPTVEPADPQGQVPLGRAYRAHSGCISSRSDWNPRSCACVLYAKGGHGCEGHGNHDAGQVCIDACGERLIVDPGSPPLYPNDFFGPSRYEYYNASVWGHNVPVFGGREMRRTKEDRAELLAAEFDEERGGWWRLDLTCVYDGVRSVRRTVVHLLPGIVAVLDEAQLEVDEEVSLRWHTADRCEPDPEGRFTVRGESASLAGLVTRLDGECSTARGEHLYRPPFDKGRLGERFEQRRESYVELRCKGRACRLLSLLAVLPPGAGAVCWERTQEGWNLPAPENAALVTLEAQALCVKNLGLGTTWEVGLGATS